LEVRLNALRRGVNKETSQATPSGFPVPGRKGERHHGKYKYGRVSSVNEEKTNQTKRAAKLEEVKNRPTDRTLVRRRTITGLRWVDEKETGLLIKGERVW